MTTNRDVVWREFCPETTERGRAFCESLGREPRDALLLRIVTRAAVMACMLDDRAMDELEAAVELWGSEQQKRCPELLDALRIGDRQ